jgi:hypothetical protein
MLATPGFHVICGGYRVEYPEKQRNLLWKIAMRQLIHGLVEPIDAGSWAIERLPCENSLEIGL